MSVPSQIGSSDTTDPITNAPNKRAPWYVIIWRVVWAPVFYGSIALAGVAVLATHGRRRARKFWRETT